jgi:hypothetical protein
MWQPLSLLGPCQLTGCSYLYLCSSHEWFSVVLWICSHFLLRFVPRFPRCTWGWWQSNLAITALSIFWLTGVVAMWQSQLAWIPAAVLLLLQCSWHTSSQLHFCYTLQAHFAPTDTPWSVCGGAGVNKSTLLSVLISLALLEVVWSENNCSIWCMWRELENVTQPPSYSIPSR